MNWEKMQTQDKSVKDKSVQKKYYDSHPFDELTKAFIGDFVPRNDIHEIRHGSYKTYEDWNMIALTRENHDLAHAEEISRKRLYLAKILNGFDGEFPKEIIRIYGLEIIIKNKEKFRRRWLLHKYHKI